MGSRAWTLFFAATGSSVLAPIMLEDLPRWAVAIIFVALWVPALWAYRDRIIALVAGRNVAGAMLALRTGRAVWVLLVIGFLALVVLYVELLGEHEVTRIETDNLTKALA